MSKEQIIQKVNDPSIPFKIFLQFIFFNKKNSIYFSILFFAAFRSIRKIEFQEFKIKPKTKDLDPLTSLSLFLRTTDTSPSKSN